LKGTFLRGVGDFTDNTKDTTLAGFQASQNLSHTHETLTTNAQLGYGGSTGQANYYSATALVTSPAGYITNVNSGGTESRPQNVGVYYLVKLYDNAAPVDVYIPPASEGIAGLVNNVAGNTAGTPILGKTDGVAVASGYVGYITKTLGSSNITPAASGSGKNVISLALPSGIWLVQGQLAYTIGAAAPAGWNSISSGLSTTTDTLPTATLYNYDGTPATTTSSGRTYITPNQVFISTGSTTAYLVGVCSYSTLNNLLFEGARSSIQAIRIA